MSGEIERKKFATDSERTGQQIVRLETETREQAGERAILAAEFRKAASQLGELRRRDTHLLRRVALLELERRHEQASFEAQSAESARLNAELADARRRLEAALESGPAESARLNAELADVRHRLEAALESQSADLTHLTAELVDARHRLEAALESGSAESARLNAELADARHRLEAALESGSAKSARLNAELVDTRHRLEAALESQSADLTHLTAELVDARHRLEAALESGSAESARLNAELADARHRLEAALEARSAESARLNAELTDARHRITELDRALEAQARQLELKRRQGDARRKRTEDLEAVLEARSAESARLNAELADARHRLKAALEARSAESAHLNAELADASHRLEAVLESRSAEVAGLNTQLMDARHHLIELRSALEAEVMQFQSVMMSTSWRLTLPLRWFAGKFPWSARQLRRILKLFWEALKFPFGSRIRRNLNASLLASSAKLLASSKLFDRDWYLGQYPDVRVADIDPVLHYLEHGASEGRNPSLLFDSDWYMQQNPDVRNAGTNPLVHYLKHGFAEERTRSPAPLRDQQTVGTTGVADINPLTHFAPHGADKGLTVGGFTAATSRPSSSLGRTSRFIDTVSNHFLSPTEEPLHDDGYSVPRFMYYLWRLRPDLRQAFDLYDRTSRLEYCKWFLLNALHEYAVPDDVYSDELLVRLAGTKGSVAATAQAILDERNKSGSGPPPIPTGSATEPELQDIREDGANLIGYCRGEFGMGEQVRAMARAFSAVQMPFSMIDYQKMGSHGSGDDSTGHWITNVKEYRTNIFCINADTLPVSYFGLGRSLFSNCYNIGYWAWELSKCPPEFDLALGMVDEVWAISDFTAESFRTRSTVPVINMPHSVSLPVLRRHYSKSYFGLPENCFQFIFTFDSASYIDRKNPIAVVRAFRLAFPRGDEKVHLLLKTMNTHVRDSFWSALIAEVDMDPRIAIMDKRLERDKVLGLNSVCDAFVSLHRSEGFGFSLAEAMLLGKPVIATNYSGSREFAREGTACVVDYRLVRVPEGSYPFSQGQLWAEPDIEHAAKLMRRLANDDSYRQNIARSGQRFVFDNFNEATIGARYAARLAELRSTTFRSVPVQSSQGPAIAPLASDVDDEIIGCIDQPALDGSKPFDVGSIEITGWAASKLGIENIEIDCDGTLLGIAFFGVLRPDIAIAFPDFKDAGRSGFFWMLDAKRLAAGRHVVRVVARSHSGQWKEWTRDFSLGSTTSYQEWLTKNTLDSEKKKLLITRAKQLKTKPAITILIVCKSIVDRDAISRSLASLADQLYQNFKVIITAAKAEIDCIQTAVDTGAIAGRIHLVPSDQPRWAEGLFNCDGDLTGVMDFGDVLEPRALLAVAENIARDSSIDFLYTDEDRYFDGVRTLPTFKPGFSPVYLDRYNYIGRPWFARTTLIEEAIESVGPKENLSEHELLKRLGRAARAVCHIPMVLVSRSSDMASFACVEAQPSEGAALPDACADETLPSISVVIPTCLHEREIITRCFNSLVERTNYPNLEVIVVLNNVPDIAAAQAFLGKWPFVVRVWEGAFNWSGINNFGAKDAGGDYLLFLNDDVDPVDPNWLKNMARIARLPSVGAVGATLKYSNNMLQHAGITISNHASGRRHCGRHVFRFCSGDEIHISPIAHHDHECRAVTGACLLTRRDCFDEINGFDENLEVVTNDTDYCLRLGERGYSSVISAASVLIHNEGISRGGIADDEDLKRFWERWASRLSADDPFSNPNLNNDKDDWSVDAAAIGTLMGRIAQQPDRQTQGHGK